MPKFTISLHGRGAEINVHNITDKQKEKLEHLDLDNCILEDVSDVLEMEDEFSLVGSDEVYIGAYPEHSVITVFDESEEVIFSDEIENLTFNELISESTSVTEIYQKNKLYVNDYIKGNFFSIIAEDDSFDIHKLELNFTDIEGSELITSIKYKDSELDFGDYWSKGIVYFLSNE
jgi:hypothetical protein